MSHKTKRLWPLIRHDISYGIVLRWKYYAAALFIFILSSFVFAAHANHFLHSSGISGALGTFDFILNVFAGNKPFDASSQTGIKLSVLWLGFYAYLLSLTTFYASDDMKKSASSFILRVKSKVVWWAGKFIWCMLSVILYYVLFVLSACCASAAFGKLSVLVNPYVCSEFFDINLHGASNGEIIVACLLLPFAVSLAVSSFHMMLSLVIRPIYSFILGICFIAAAAFRCHPMLIFNFTMAERNALFSPASSISVKNGLISAVCLLLFSFFAGAAIIKRKDII